MKMRKKLKGKRSYGNRILNKGRERQKKRKRRKY